MDEILWCDHSYESSSAVLSNGSIHITYFIKWNLGFVLNFDFKHSWERKGLENYELWYQIYRVRVNIEVDGTGRPVPNLKIWWVPTGALINVLRAFFVPWESETLWNNLSTTIASSTHHFFSLFAQFTARVFIVARDLQPCQACTIPFFLSATTNDVLDLRDDELPRIIKKISFSFRTSKYYAFFQITNVSNLEHFHRVSVWSNVQKNGRQLKLSLSFHHELSHALVNFRARFLGTILERE